MCILSWYGYLRINQEMVLCKTFTQSCYLTEIKDVKSEIYKLNHLEITLYILQNVSEKSIFCNLTICSNLVQKMSNFNSMCRNN